MNVWDGRRQPRVARLLALALAIAAVSPSGGSGRPAPAAEEERSDFYTLANGLRVYLMENRTLPLVHMVVAVDLGSKNEADETNGLSHVLEHYILFRGTNSRTAEEISRDIRRHGAYFNAFTGLDLAQFEMTLPAGQEEFALSNQKDILFNLKIDAEALEAEKEVVLEELNQQEDDPLQSATSLVYQKIFAGHPYARPIAGTRKSIAGLTAAQLGSFYRTFFTPSNSVLAVVGDFSLPDLKEKVARIFGSLPGGEPPPGQILPASGPNRDQSFTLSMDVNQAYCVIGLTAPDYNHPDQYAVDVLTEIIGRGARPLLSSALARNRVRVDGLSMSYQALRLGGILLITMTLDPSLVQAAQRETLSFLRRVRNSNFSPEEFLGAESYYAYDYLRSAKNQIRYSAEKSQELGMNLAVSLARHMILSNGRAGGGYLENIGRITSSDLRRAAAKYLSAANIVSVRVVPSGREPGP